VARILLFGVALALVAGGRAGADPSAAFDRYRQPDRLVASLGLRDGDRVADVGAGPGYLTFRLAQAVGARGGVVATDVDATALARIDGAVQPAELRARVRTRRVAADDPGLEAHAYDLILLSEVDHLLPDRVAYLRRLVAALKPRGRIAVTNLRTFQARLLAAADGAGLRAHESAFTTDHFLIFLEVK
jgi:ubiquinone/menaquinone biosynthesis C-methylase UbiE